MSEEDTFKALKRRPFGQVVSFLLSEDNKGGAEATRIVVESMGWTVEEFQEETQKQLMNLLK